MALPHRVLLVDDEPAVLTALKLAFDDSRSFEVITAQSADEALRLLDGGRVDLVITDKNLPDGSGLELSRAIKRSAPRLPVILITGYANAESRADGDALGLAGYLEKPFGDIYDIPRLALHVLRQ